MRSLLLASAILLVAPASAQRAHTDGLFLQVSVDAQSLFFNEDDIDQRDEGSGLSLRAGYGVSRVVTLYGGIAGSRVEGATNGVIDEPYDWGGAEVGARFNLLPSRRVQPYLDVALRGVSARNDDFDLEFTGGGVTLGGGVAYFVSPSVALDAGLRLGGGGFDEVRLGRFSVEADPEDLGYGEGRFSLGATVYPLR